MIAIAPVSPIFKWAGNKHGTPIADRVSELFAPYRNTHTWVEPFCGALGMSLSINPRSAVLCDGSRELIEFYRWVRSGGEFVELPEQVTEENYYAFRDEFQSGQSELYASVDLLGDRTDRFFSLMVWLNRACYNGLWRVNSKGFFNVPVGKNSKGEHPIVSMPNLEGLRSVLSNGAWSLWEVTFDYIDLIQQVTKDCDRFFYADPPYWKTHSAYISKGFTWDDQVALCKWLAVQDCPVVASNSCDPRVTDLYFEHGFTIELIPVKRSISSNGDRTPAVEMLAHKGCEV